MDSSDEGVRVVTRAADANDLIVCRTPCIADVNVVRTSRYVGSRVRTQLRCWS